MTAALPAPTRLTILYDEGCALCRRVRDWLLTQPCLVPIELLAAGSSEAARRFGTVPGAGSELAAVDDQGNVWIGPPAYLVSMWATARFRPWAYRLSRPGLDPLARRFFLWVSARRDRWGAALVQGEDCSWCHTDPECERGHRMRADAKFCIVCGASSAPRRLR